MTPLPVRALAFALLVPALAGNRAADAQVWEVDNLLLLQETPESGAGYGRVLARGDFDDDGIDDLAVAAPYDDRDGVTDLGSARVLLGAGRTFELRADLPAGLPTADRFIGQALATGNFDSSPQDELVLGVPGRTDLGVQGAGGVTVAFFAVGAPAIGFAHIQQSEIPAPAGGSPGGGDALGSALAVGDFDGDGFDDLAAAAPFADLSPDTPAVGKVYVLYGGNPALDPAGADSFFAVDAQGSARFGAALAAGDFDGDGFDDLAIGEPGRTISGQSSAGRIQVLFGSASGVVSAGAQLLDQGSFGLAIEAGDEFGSALAAGDFDDDGVDDLAIGVPREDLGATLDAGFVLVSFGTDAVGLSTSRTQAFNQADLGFATEPGDQFGEAVVAVNLDGDRASDPAFAASDLVIGVPFEDVVGGQSNQGIVHLVRGASGVGLAIGESELQQQFPGYRSAPGALDDGFGTAATAGDFDGDGESDLAIGIPWRDVGSAPAAADAGLVQVLWGALFADGFERGSDEGWSAITP